MTEPTETVVPLFDKLMQETKEEADKRRLTLTKRRVIRSFQSALDSAEAGILDAETKIENLLSNMKKNGTLDVNTLLKYRLEMIDFEVAKKILNEEYVKMFGGQP